MNQPPPDDDRTRTYVPLNSGELIGHYRIIERIGAGGMGEVYLAEDTELKRKVALKLLPPHLCLDADCRKRFKREAQAAAKLDHPNIVSVFDVGEFQGRPYFSMQHVQGQPLTSMIAAKALSLNRIVDIGIQICDGLQAAHDLGITHRDIKPSNILIDSHGRARIVDFGLASVAGTDQLTKTGSTLGTIGYMSPEQVRGDRVDNRSDLFSLGVVLYELIAGHSPFKSESEAATLHAITTARPEPLARFRRDVPDALQAIVDKALDKNVATRYQHADEIGADLRKSLSGEFTMAPKARHRTWNLFGVIAGIGILVVILAYLLANWYSVRTGTPDISKRKMLAVLPFENLGSPQDEYFADGITDEITTRLAGLSGLGVISRTSSMQYKKSSKSLKQIGKELKVEYVLEGTIRWEKTGSENRVRINPQLVRVADDSHLWATGIDAVLTDVFSVQAKIAQEVAAALNVTLLQPEQEVLSHSPEVNAAGYDCYLRSKQYFSVARFQQNDYRSAETLLRRAIELAPDFAPAYAEMGTLYVEAYWDGFKTTPATLDSARQLIDIARRLAPNTPEAHQALGWYYYHGIRDYQQAYDEFAQVLHLQPNNVLAMASTAWVQRRRGNWDDAFRGMESVTSLAPRESWYKYELGVTYFVCRRYQDAVSQFDQVIELQPDHRWAYDLKAWTQFSQTGQTTEPRRTLSAACASVGRWPELTWFEVYFDCLDHQYDSALKLLTARGSVLFPEGSDSSDYFYMKAIVFSLMHNEKAARVYYDSARTELEGKVALAPGVALLHGALSMVYAGLGHKDKAVLTAKKAVELLPETRDALEGTIYVRNLAMVYAMVGEYDQAIALFDHLLSEPANVSVHWLQVAPGIDSLRATPGFKALLQKHR
ncbi:MAG TPA: protein kinase [Candidatus Acidoferrum sp.]|nr:protein kinase [Candidatus Acidoferrum sp.]